MYDWDDLRVFLAAARALSLSGAAQRLTIDAATVGRRLSRLETGLKATLFVRSPSGLQLTASGGRLLEAALAAEAAMEGVERVGERDVASGTVRISASEGFGAAIIAPGLPAFRAARPHLRIELAAQSGFLSPSKREVEIAVTLAAPTSTRLVIEPLTDYELGLYAAPAYLDKAGTPASVAALTEHEIVGYVEDLLYAPELNYLNEVQPDLRPALSSTSIRAQREIIEAGGGVGVLPCFLSAGLKRVLPAKVRIRRRFWLSTHRDVADAARVRSVRDWLQALVKQNAARLLPK